MKFTEVLDIAGIEWNPSESKEGEVMLCCPFCIEQNETVDTRFRLGINASRDLGHCYNCNWGSRQSTVSKVLTALKIEAEDDEEEEKKDTKKVEFDGELPDGFELLYPLKRDETFQQAYFYLLNRGVTEHQINANKIGFTLVGKWSYRVIFPIIDYSHKKNGFFPDIFGFVGRDFTERQKLRYLNSIGSKALYGKHHKDRSVAMIVEGIFDKLAIDRVLDEVDSFALLQRTIRDNQIKQLEKYDRIIRVPDDNRPGLNGLIKDCNKLLSMGINVWYSRLNKKYEDVSDALRHKSKQSIRDLFSDAKQWTEYEEQKLKMEIANEYRGVKEL